MPPQERFPALGSTVARLLLHNCPGSAVENQPGTRELTQPIPGDGVGDVPRERVIDLNRNSCPTPWRDDYLRDKRTEKYRSQGEPGNPFVCCDNSRQWSVQQADIVSSIGCARVATQACLGARRIVAR